MENVDEAYRLKLEIETKTAEFKASIATQSKELARLQDLIRAEGAGKYEGATAKATVSIRHSVSLDTRKVIDAVEDPGDLAGIVTVRVPAAKEFLSSEAFEGAATHHETTVLKLSAKS